MFQFPWAKQLMGRSILILTFILCSLGSAYGQPLSIDELLNLVSLSPQHYDDYLSKKGFPIKRRTFVENSMGFAFFQNRVPGDTTAVERSINLYKEKDTWYAAFHTSSAQEYIEGRTRLKSLNFYFDATTDSSIEAAQLFQKKTITVETTAGQDEDAGIYTFLVVKKAIPDRSSIRYAEDLLRFDSHEYLISCYGEKNVKKNTYIFSENNKKKCSVLFPNTDEQAVFIGTMRRIIVRFLMFLLAAHYRPPTPGNLAVVSAIINGN
ncbi:MAG: hypothetical protein ACHQFX_18845 [Chitinophagales bacterium]